MPTENKLSHLDKTGKASMVDVAGKTTSERFAHAQGFVELPQGILDLIQDNDIQTKKGSVFQTAIIAGTMASKRTSELIPLCHLLPLDSVKLSIKVENNLLVIDCFVKNTGKTGVEMEALTGVSIAALTIYDMCKALSHNIIIKETKLIEKIGGKHHFKR